MFSLPVAGEAEGSCDSNPIRLEGITKTEFKRFLQVLLLGAFEEAAAPDSVFDMWFPVVKLARMWEFDAIHKRAVQNMPYERISRPSAEKVGLAVHYDIQPWLLPAVNELARRKEPLENDDLAVLGPELALKVAAVRESLAVSRSHYKGTPRLTSGLRDASMVDFTSVIKSVFQLSDKVCAPETGDEESGI
ncbi:hypothetical protein JVT61DRAFT_629 [Boletus reticuloceps]|uniref:Uncharacterized protein n=1 Tax=Boletus reticuloceps TaxID=495285 RepID=A0A8I3AE30_9AGAM|nr:hypothetical protein JVT61DRAFT_629 [Boletus reticuloceps]